ncbi:GtrA family protein [Rufibacter latericius]|uniref:GtrA family protein n=1 Tax=Rufibacter latericius TaxID=2487040 RepID=A0A3M9M9M2_9BACT|nr:GtrA family protein [Rufibacter latericius]RNI21877.1 GtrA family protein [Rufibacter latericius]
MFTFLRSQFASLLASGVDYLVTIIAVELGGLWYVAATVLGTICGGITHFSIGRNWVFQAAHRTIPTQASKYFLVWNGSLLLNASGVFMLTHYLGFNYIYSKVTVSLLVGFFYNFILQKRYVFS